MTIARTGDPAGIRGCETAASWRDFCRANLKTQPVSAFVNFPCLWSPPGRIHSSDETAAMDIGKDTPVSKKSSRPKGLTPIQQVSIVLGSGALVAVAIGSYLVVTHVNAAPPTSSVASATMPRDHAGDIIARAPDGKGCRRMKFNNATGTISDAGPASCDEADASAPPAAASSGANSERFGAIANGFRR
jgi:hypothetical protein